MKLLPFLIYLLPALAAAKDPVGLMAGDAALPLLRTDVSAVVSGDLANVSLMQVFGNSGESPRHLRYIFPLPENAAVHAMRFTIGDRVIEGEIQEIQRAKQTFAKAKAEGKQAALLTQHRPNVFTQELANVMPGQPVQVEIEYVHVVPRKDGDYRFVFPMVVGPRYLGPADKAVEKAMNWALPSSPPIVPAAKLSERVGLTVLLDGGRPIQWLDSPSHVIDTKPVADQTLVTLRDARVADDQDFELRYRLAGTQTAAGVTTYRDGGEGVVSLLIEPPAVVDEAAVTAREIVFVLDCSGSMHGAPLDAAKRFAHQALGGLRATDFFRVVRFSTNATEMAARPTPATPENVRAGYEYLASLSGGGGTQMVQGIEAALAPAVPPGAVRILVFLTDGYIGDDMHVARVVEEKIGDARLYAFGVGNSVNRYLLEELARTGRGVARIMRPDADLEHEADLLAERLASPVLTDLRVDWGAAPVAEITPARLPDVFLGQPVRLLARYSEPGRYPITVHGKVAGEAIRLPLTIDLPAQATAGRALPIVWARAQVADRMHRYGAPGATEADNEQVKKEVLALGLAHHLVTRWTAFVAVDKVVSNPGGEAKSGDVPVSKANGVPETAYQFNGKAAPEPATWAALLMLLALAWRFRGAVRVE